MLGKGKIRMNKVSVIMPAFNCEEFIDRTIESVLKQEYENWELIIVDDCSTDKTSDIAEKYAKTDSRIKILKNKTNKGAACSRNTAIEYASGRYLAFLDSDDVWNCKKLAKQIDYMEKNAFSFTCTAYDKIDESDNSLNRVIKCHDCLDYRGILKHCPGNSTVVYDAEVLGKFFIPNIRKRNDYVMWLQVIKKAEELHGLEEVLSSHRVREQSLSSKKVSLIKYHWMVYRKIEDLGLLESVYLTIYWILKSVLHKVKELLFEKRSEKP